MERKEIMLSAEQVSIILNINEITVKKLAKSAELPCTYQNRRPVFNLERLKEYFQEIEEAAI